MKIKLKQQYCCKEYKIKNHYDIYYANQLIGEISFIKRKDILVIGFIGIFQEYQNQHYGYQVIEYLLSHYKIKCITGQSLNTSKGFWNKCIKKYNGVRKNISTLDNCSSSFIISKTKIENSYLYELLESAHEIEW